MFRDQIINFLETTIVFLLLTNALTAAAAAWSIRMMNAMAPDRSKDSGAIVRRIDAMLRRVG
jgi:hypothetical protein